MEGISKAKKAEAKLNRRFPLIREGSKDKREGISKAKKDKREGSKGNRRFPLGFLYLG
jgi:hypothetical protein